MIRRKELYKEATALIVSHDFRVRFNEVDSLGIVWHGHYITYFEEGREAFGRKHGLGYLDVFANDYATPIVKTTLEHKLSLRYGDVARIETTIVDTPAAKMIFRFTIFNDKNEIVCTGETVQVFIDKQGELMLTNPQFYTEWKQKVGLESKMIREVYITETNCITPLGFDVATNIKNIGNEVSGIQLQDNPKLFNAPFYASVINDKDLDLALAKVSQSNQYSRLEKMMILALEPIIKKAKVNLNERTAFILSTTKGNISVLENQENIESAYLNVLAKKIADFFQFATEPVVVSNACVSGILAVSVAKRLIQASLFDNIFIVAGDEVTKFVVSGFNSFQALSSLPCKPYSINRTGVTLGEATAAVLVSSNKENAKIKVIGDGSINDANHISGPSRTGEGLFRSIQSALAEAEINSNQIDYISAHGTATPFNDEMEAIALNRLGLENVPVNSLKGYYGHTLGTSGLLETVIGIESVSENKLFTSLGFDSIGVSQPINIIEKNEDKEIRYFLKTASGFGGCNTAVLFEKVQ